MRCSPLACFLPVLLVLGCGGSTEVKHTIQGKVTLNGSALEEGNIVFDSVDGKSSSEMVKIVNGAYQARLTPGPRTVRIRAERLVPGKLDKLGMPLREDLVPMTYNSSSTLKINVQEDKIENFDLKK